MKIIFVLPDMPGGGTERVVALLANEYIKRGYSVAILLFAGKMRRVVSFRNQKSVRYSCRGQDRENTSPYTKRKNIAIPVLFIILPHTEQPL